MRIAYMLTSLGIGGAERQVVPLAERMARRGPTVALTVLKPRIGQDWPPSWISFKSTCARRPRVS